MNRCILQKGLTLIEVMIVVAVLGIITAIAYPSYQEHVEKGRRTAAQASLMELQLWAEQYYTNSPSLNKTYPNSSDLSTGTNKCEQCTLADEYTYSISNTGKGQDRFIITASVIANGKQTGDACKALSINAAGVKKGYGSNNKPLSECW
ncbi:hypothetical protein ABT56_15315 [Photobacterium aquae]|uniref:Fimbrial protein n=1 Tax=Photobacterium aquae TaxID=1195763 RepID=A0A0J1GXV2_9GAMM|nr:type IV pilin protein [Photobacterium aquae]KLV04495.1 hypothetical protein ABT56_15315 [Photobacterium aquae]